MTKEELKIMHILYKRIKRLEEKDDIRDQEMELVVDFIQRHSKVATDR